MAEGSTGTTSARGTSSFKEKTNLWFIAILRIFVGYFFLMSGINKIRDGALADPEKLIGLLEEWSASVPAWYADFLQQAVIPNGQIFNYLVVSGEVLVGACLILGLFSRFAGFFGMVMTFNFFFATYHMGPASQGINSAFFFICLVILLSGAGRSIGVDRKLRKKIPWL